MWVVASFVKSLSTFPVLNSSGKLNSLKFAFLYLIVNNNLCLYISGQISSLVNCMLTDLAHSFIARSKQQLDCNFSHCKLRGNSDWKIDINYSCKRNSCVTSMLF